MRQSAHFSVFFSALVGLLVIPASALGQNDRERADTAAAPAEIVDPVGIAVEEAVRLYGSPELLLESSDMLILEHSDEMIRGTVTLDFHGQKTSFTSSMTTPTLVKLQIVLGDVVLEAEADLAAGTRILDGHAHAITVEERLALIALGGHLARAVQCEQNELLPHEDWALRMLSYLGEAPVGSPIPRLTVTLPLAVSFATPHDDQSDLAGSCPSNNENFIRCDDDFLCGESSQSGVRYIKGCGTGIHTLWHDACLTFNHDYCAENILVGCDLVV